MPNSAVSKAVEAVITFCDLADKLALAPVTIETTDCLVEDDNRTFRDAQTAAQLAVEGAMDEVDGLRLGLFEIALENLGRSQESWVLRVPHNRLIVQGCAESARRAVISMRAPTAKPQD